MDFKTTMCLKFLSVFVHVCAKPCTSMSACVTVDVLSKGLHRSVRGPLIRHSMLSMALEMGGCPCSRRWSWVDTVERLLIWPRYSNMTSAAYFPSHVKAAGRASKGVCECVFYFESTLLHYYSARTSNVCSLLCCSRNRGQRFLGIRFTLILHFFYLVDRECFLLLLNGHQFGLRWISGGA